MYSIVKRILPTISSHYITTLIKRTQNPINHCLSTDSLQILVKNNKHCSYNRKNKYIHNNMNLSLQKKDFELYTLIEKEKSRQHEGLELIASENITSTAVLECLGSILTNKYSEGLPGKRYYGGNEVIDEIENLCIKRALEAYKLDKEEWGVNVQPYSGSSANFEAYTALLEPHDRIMGLDLPSGGHLTHGFFTSKKKVSATSVYFESLPYSINNDGYIDYDEMENLAKVFKPKLIICGYSAYSRDLDYERFRKISDINKSYLLCDMAHFSGLVATGEFKNPFDYCDVVTTTTHKTLRGPRAGMIFYKKEFENKVNQAVFPMLQGGPHEHQIAAIATQLKEVMTPEFKKYIQQVKLNAKKLSIELTKKGYHISTGGTDNHQILVNLRNKGITGSKIEKICEKVNISINKNAVYGDKSALSPGGIRLGTPSLTTRGMTVGDMTVVANLLDEAIQIALQIQRDLSEEGKVCKLVDFCKELDDNKDVIRLKEKVRKFAILFG